jgi:hypothetical protein
MIETGVVFLLDLDKLRLGIRDILKLKAVKIALLVLTGIFLCLGALECWLNFRVRYDLRQALGWGSGPQVKIDAHINWLSLTDVIKGRVGWVRIDGTNCLISNLRFTELHLKNEGFTFSLPLLLRDRTLKLVHLYKTSIHAKVAAAAFSNYVNLYYPQFKPAVAIYPGELVFNGKIQVFRDIVPVEIAGLVKIASPKDLRFYPIRLVVSGRTVPPKYLHYIGNQIPLQFTVMADWPLALTGVSLNSGYVLMDFKEIAQ